MKKLLLIALLLSVGCTKRTDLPPDIPPHQPGYVQPSTPTADPPKPEKKAETKRDIAPVLTISFDALRESRRQVWEGTRNSIVARYSGQVKNWYFWDHFIVGVVHLQYDFEADARKSFDEAVKLEPRLKPGVERLFEEYRAVGYVARPYDALYEVLGK